MSVGNGVIVGASASVSAESRRARTAENFLPDCKYTLRYEFERNQKFELKSGGNAVAGKLPDIIAVYSGEETRLQRIFSESSLSPQFRYLNRNYWSAALLTLLLRMWKTREISSALQNPSAQKEPSDKPFLSKALGRSVDISKVKITIQTDEKRLNNAIKSKDDFLTFLNRIFLGKTKFEDTPEMLCNRLCGKITSRSDGAEMFSSNEGDGRFVEGKLLFDLLSKASVGEKRVLSDISIQIPVQNGEHVELSLLSEGEKKMILIKAILETCFDTNTLLLLDEPDAHVYEGRKEELLKMLLDYSEKKIQIVMTTHSPGLVHKALSEKNAQVLWMRGDKGIMDASDSASLLKEMNAEEFSHFWDAMGFLQRPLALFEGPSDVKYIRKAMELLGRRQDADFLPAGSSGSATDFLSSLLNMFPDRTIFAFFDHDEAGKQGAQSMIRFLFKDAGNAENIGGTEPTSEQIKQAQKGLERSHKGISIEEAGQRMSSQKESKRNKEKRKTEKSSPVCLAISALSGFKDPDTAASNYPNVTVHFIPLKDGVKAEKGFQIEDYFSYSVICKIVEDEIRLQVNQLSVGLSDPKTINMFSSSNLDLKNIVKAKLNNEKKLNELTTDDVKGFEILWERIRKLAEAVKNDGRSQSESEKEAAPSDSPESRARVLPDMSSAFPDQSGKEKHRNSWPDKK
ncbi:MAG: AAA family ATPase [Oscillibacter sp.]|nr:AAA family ATPase [Oscillibacter sp.]